MTAPERDEEAVHAADMALIDAYVPNLLAVLGEAMRPVFDDRAGEQP